MPHEFGQCKICGTWRLGGRHKCPAKWKCWDAENEEEMDTDIYIFAPTPEEAAEKFPGEAYAGDPWHDGVVAVRISPDEVQHFTVDEDWEPVYSSHQVQSVDGKWVAA